jgi:hypothetical protein
VDRLQIHGNLGRFLRLAGVRNDSVDQLEEAIAHLTLALEVNTLDQFPREWFNTNSSLVLALSDSEMMRPSREIGTQIISILLFISLKTTNSDQKTTVDRLRKSFIMFREHWGDEISFKWIDANQTELKELFGKNFRNAIMST